MTDHITISMDDLRGAMGAIRPETLRAYADAVEGNRQMDWPTAANLIRLIADALPKPLPTTDGSTAQDGSGAWYVLIEGAWRLVSIHERYVLSDPNTRHLAAIHDAGADQ